jgi:hypothetical protein
MNGAPSDRGFARKIKRRHASQRLVARREPSSSSESGWRVFPFCVLARNARLRRSCLKRCEKKQKNANANVFSDGPP